MGNKGIGYSQLTEINGTLLLTAMTNLAYGGNYGEKAVEEADLSLHISADAGQTWVEHRYGGDVAPLKRSIATPFIHYLGSEEGKPNEVLLLLDGAESNSHGYEYEV
jgi:hypothetical protein